MSGRRYDSEWHSQRCEPPFEQCSCHQQRTPAELAEPPHTSVGRLHTHMSPTVTAVKCDRSHRLLYVYGGLAVSTCESAGVAQRKQ